MPRTADFTRIKKIVLEHINAAEATYGTYSTNPRFKREYIMDEIINSDFDFAVAICLNPDHPERTAYKQSAVAVTHNGEYPSSTGEISALLISRSDGSVVTGKTAPANLIDIWKADTNNWFGTPRIKEGYYWTGNGQVKFTGTSATVVTYDVQHGTWSGAAGSEIGTLRAPEQCESAIAAFTLAKLYRKQDDMPGVSSFYMTITVAAFEAISSGGLPIPKIEQYQQQRG